MKEELENQEIQKYDKIFLKIAYLFSQQSYCKKLKVGAILTKENRILVNAYNGTLSGQCNDCEDVITFDETIQEKFSSKKEFNKKIEELKKYNIKYLQSFETEFALIYSKYQIKTSPFVLHAEENAITFAAKNGIPTKGLTMYITHSPCERCARLIASAGIKRVVFITDYGNGIEFLKKAGIEVQKIEKDEIFK